MRVHMQSMLCILLLITAWSGNKNLLLAYKDIRAHSVLCYAVLDTKISVFRQSK